MKILFVCSAGMSSSLIADKLNAYYEKKGGENTVDSFSLSELNQKIDLYDAVLVGPQLRYTFKSIEEMCRNNNKPVYLVSPVEYGKQDAKKIAEGLDLEISKTLKKRCK